MMKTELKALEIIFNLSTHSIFRIFEFFEVDGGESIICTVLILISTAYNFSVITSNLLRMPWPPPRSGQITRFDNVLTAVHSSPPGTGGLLFKQLSGFLFVYSNNSHKLRP